MAIPLFSIRFGHIDAGVDPTSDTDRVAYDAISTGFGKGAKGRLVVVVDLNGASTMQVQQLQQGLQKDLTATGDVASATLATLSSDGALLSSTVVPRSGPQDGATDALMTTLRETTLPDAVADTPARGYVTGSTVYQLDFRNRVAARLPLIIGVVITAAFLLLLITFRSPVLALKAGILNVFSIGASYGVVVAVFRGAGAVPCSECRRRSRSSPTSP